MAHPTLPQPFSTTPQQAFTAAVLDRFVAQIAARPTLGTCDYKDEFVDCRKQATVHHLGLEREFCAEHFRKVVGRG